MRINNCLVHLSDAILSLIVFYKAGNFIRIMTFLIAAISILSCTTPSKLQRESKVEFEGVITYSIEYESDNYSPEQIKELVGAKMVMTFKEGNYSKRYFASDGKLLSERFLDLKANRSYTRVFDSDTIFWVDVSKHDSKATFVQIQDSTILQQPTTGIEATIMVSQESEGGDFQKMITRYHFAKNLFINPERYANYKEANFNEIIALGKGVQLSIMNKGIHWDQIISAVSIEPKDVKMKDILIELDPNIPIKEL